MANEQFLITREIGIDAGHRVPDHASKCRSLHGHRYTIQATCRGPLIEAGEQRGMVLDFGFLKEEMMQEIDAPCDHGMILWEDDPWVQVLRPAAQGFASAPSLKQGAQALKLYVVDFTPTAENLARHWFQRLAPRVQIRSEGVARLQRVRVWETPNCYADFCDDLFA